MLFTVKDGEMWLMLHIATTIQKKYFHEKMKKGILKGILLHPMCLLTGVL